MTILTALREELAHLDNSGPLLPRVLALVDEAILHEPVRTTADPLTDARLSEMRDAYVAGSRNHASSPTRERCLDAVALIDAYTSLREDAKALAINELEIVLHECRNYYSTHGQLTAMALGSFVRKRRDALRTPPPLEDTPPDKPRNAAWLLGGKPEDAPSDAPWLRSRVEELRMRHVGDKFGEGWNQACAAVLDLIGDAPAPSATTTNDLLTGSAISSSPAPDAAAPASPDAGLREAAQRLMHYEDGCEGNMTSGSFISVPIGLMNDIRTALAQPSRAASDAAATGAVEPAVYDLVRELRTRVTHSSTGAGSIDDEVQVVEADEVLQWISELFQPYEDATAREEREMVEDQDGSLRPLDEVPLKPSPDKGAEQRAGALRLSIATGAEAVLRELRGKIFLLRELGALHKRVFIEEIDKLLAHEGAAGREQP